MIDEKVIEWVNKIIHEAIEHGGDSGGAYFSNKECLVNTMKHFLRCFNLHNNFGIMDENGWLRFYKKSDIVE